MIPVALDPSRLRVGLAARGASGLRRLGLLQAGGATHIAMFCDEPDSELGRAAPDASLRLPGPDDIAALHLLWVTGLPPPDAARLAHIARALRVAVNVEDAPALCDFHNVAEIRRGDLLLTVSTGGSSPGLATAVRAALVRQFGPEWEQRLRIAAEQRQQWRDDGLEMAEVSARLDALARAEGWLQ